MRGLEDALARIARRDELRGRTNVTRRTGDAMASVSPVVDEVADALRAVVERNPGVFATVVVQEAETTWSVWIGEWDGTLHTRVTELDPDPPTTVDPGVLDQPTKPLTVPGGRRSEASTAPQISGAGVPVAAGSLPVVAGAGSLPAVAAAGTLSAVAAGGSLPAVAGGAPLPVAPPLSAVPQVTAPVSTAPGAQEPVIPLPRRRPSLRPVSLANRAAAALPAGPTHQLGPAPIAELLRPRSAVSAGSLSDAETPPMGFRPPLAGATSAGTGIPLPGRSTLTDADAPLPGRSTLADAGAPLPSRSALIDPGPPTPSRSALADPGAPLPKRFPDTGIPLPRRRPALPSGAQLSQNTAATPMPALPALPSVPSVPTSATAMPPQLPALRAPLAAAVPAQRPPVGSAIPQVPAARAPLPPPRVPLTAAAPSLLPAEPEDTTWPPHYQPSHRVERAGHRADAHPAPAGATPALPMPTIPAPPLAAAQRVSGPAMNDRVAGRIAEMLRREAKRDNRGLTS